MYTNKVDRNAEDRDQECHADDNWLYVEGHNHQERADQEEGDWDSDSNLQSRCCKQQNVKKESFHTITLIGLAMSGLFQRRYNKLAMESRMKLDSTTEA